MGVTWVVCVGPRCMQVMTEMKRKVGKEFEGGSVFSFYIYRKI
jgi:hypothetical protein